MRGAKGSQNSQIKKEVGVMASPVKKFAAGAIQVAVWENSGKSADGLQATYRTVSIDKRYKDKNDEWKSSNSLHINDIPKAILALQKAYEYLALKGYDTETDEIIA